MLDSRLRARMTIGGAGMTIEGAGFRLNAILAFAGMMAGMMAASGNQLSPLRLFFRPDGHCACCEKLLTLWLLSLSSIVIGVSVMISGTVILFLFVSVIATLTNSSLPYGDNYCIDLIPSGKFQNQLPLQKAMDGQFLLLQYSSPPLAKFQFLAIVILNGRVICDAWRQSYQIFKCCSCNNNKQVQNYAKHQHEV